MNSSLLSITNVQNKPYAQGYTANNIPVRNSAAGLLGGSWAIKSSGEDMSRYLNAAIGNKRVPVTIAAAMKMAQTGYFQCSDNKMNQLELGLGWLITPLDKSTQYKKLLQAPAHYNLDKPLCKARKIKSPTYKEEALIDKQGATDGFRSYIAVMPSRKVGIVILTNKFTQNTGALQNLGRKILFKILDRT